MTQTPRHSPASAAVLAFVIDVVLVVAFAAIGRASHAEGVLGTGGLGLATTAWPFLVGLLVGWAATLGWRRPFGPVRTGLGAWAATLGIGMLLRLASGQGIALAFVIVAAITLLVFLVGWRLIALGVRALMRRSAAR